MSGGFASTGTAGFTGGGGGSTRTILDDDGGGGYTATDGMTLPDADVVIFSSGGSIVNFADPAGPQAPTTIECQDTVSFTHGSGIRLVNAIDATIGATRNETITFAYDGVDWYEVSRGAATASSDPSPVHVTHNADQSIADSTLTLLAFNTERYDASAQHDTSTNNERLTAAVTGKYHVWANVLWAANATGTRLLECWRNNTNEVARDWRIANTGAAAYTTNHIDVTIALTAGDYVTVKAYQTSTGALDVKVVDQASPEFGMEWVSA